MITLTYPGSDSQPQHWSQIFWLVSNLTLVTILSTAVLLLPPTSPLYPLLFHPLSASPAAIITEDFRLVALGVILAIFITSVTSIILYFTQIRKVYDAGLQKIPEQEEE